MEKSSLFPRRGSAMYNMTHEDTIRRRKTLRRWKSSNKYFVIPLYKIGLLPLLGVGRMFLLLTTVGRKSGKKRTTPLEYHWIDGEMHIFSGRGEDSDWFKNLKANPDKVWVRHGFHWFKPEAQILTDNEEKTRIIRWYVKKHPGPSKKLFGWDPGNDDPKSIDLKKFAESFPIIIMKRPTKT